MRPLTDEKPKPLIEVCGKPLIEHVVGALPSQITELVLVVGYKAEQIKAHCGEEYLGKKVQYVTQADFAGGTGDALRCAKDLVRGKFLFMYADDVHGPAALAEAVEHDHTILAAYSDHPEDFGVLIENEDGTLKEILEKPKNPPNNKVNIGGLVLQPSIFEYEVPVSKEHGELIVTDMITDYAADHPVEIVLQERWLPVGKPADIAVAEAILCPKDN
jgi:NDP-sugar pyrophosphorylase family protein